MVNNSRIYKTKYRDLPYEEVEQYLMEKYRNKNRWEKYRNTPIDIIIPAVDKFLIINTTHDCIGYAMVDDPNSTLCPHLIEIGD